MDAVDGSCPDRLIGLHLVADEGAGEYCCYDIAEIARWSVDALIAAVHAIEQLASGKTSTLAIGEFYISLDRVLAVQNGEGVQVFDVDEIEKELNETALLIMRAGSIAKHPSRKFMKP